MSDPIHTAELDVFSFTIQEYLAYIYIYCQSCIKLMHVLHVLHVAVS